jgi:hypothetical protein
MGRGEEGFQHRVSRGATEGTEGRSETKSTVRSASLRTGKNGCATRGGKTQEHRLKPVLLEAGATGAFFMGMGWDKMAGEG